jgi:hypothetical protein
MKIPLVANELLHMDRRRERYGRIDITKPIVVFRKLANEPKKTLRSAYCVDQCRRRQGTFIYDRNSGKGKGKVCACPQHEGIQGE